MLQGFKTYIGIAVIVIAFLAGKLGYVVNVELLTAFLHASLNDIGVLIGAGVAWWGRAKAYETFISKK